MRKRSQLVSVTAYTPRNKTPPKQSKLSLGPQVTAGFTQPIENVLTDHPTANQNARPDEGLESSTLGR